MKQAILPIDKIFDSFISDLEKRSNIVPMPLELVDEKDKYILKAEIPGVGKEDISVTYDDGVLRIEAEKKEETKTGKFSEIVYGKVIREVSLRGVEGDKIQAEYKNGVLTVEAPKKNKESVKIEFKD